MTASLSDFTVPVLRGDFPLSSSQFNSRILARKRRVLTETEQAMLLALSPAQATDMANFMQWLMNEAHVNNLFNHQRAAYLAAVQRLDRYPLSEGRAEVRDDLPTGETDDVGNPITESVVVQPAIESLAAEIETVNEDGQTVMVPNPAIVADGIERGFAMETVASTPQQVVDYDGT